MASPVDIANMALASLGAEHLVASLDPPDGSVEAGYCATFYPLARTVMLEMAKPAFAQRRATLALQAENLSPRWAYAYALPSDCLRPLRIPPAGASGLLFTDDEVSILALDADQGSAAFVREGATLYSDEEDASLVYVADETDTTRWTPSFVEAVQAMLAGLIAGPIIKGAEGAAAARQWREAAYALGAGAAATVANGSSEPTQYIPAGIRARA